MKFFESFRVALGSLLSNQMRTLLATLGIAIGITAVSTLLSVGQSFQRFAMSQFEGLETDALTLSAQPDYGSMGGGVPPDQARLSVADIEAIRGLPNVREVATRYNAGGELSAGGILTGGGIIGADPAYLRPTMRMAIGRFLSEQDIAERTRVVVLDWSMAQQLFPDGRPMGREVLVLGLSFRVIGVLAPPKNFFLFGGGTAIVPISIARDRLFPEAALGTVQVNEATIYLDDVTRLAPTQAAVSNLLRSRHKLRPEQGNDFSFQNYGEFAEANNNILVGITVFLGVIGGIALLVGGIGIMNIMLVSVTERTREIGLRMAVGARPKDILKQFRVEAITLSMIGGLVGILLGAGASYLIGEFAGWRTDITPQAIALAVGFSAGVGVFFGFYPARKASRLLPIEALRYE
ncbi:MAG: FtsX-like permease family protein [Chloroflexales bacterium]|nr:FtsX-like permease family protein [Chloroflexales bacterium]